MSKTARQATTQEVRMSDTYRYIKLIEAGQAGSTDAYERLLPRFARVLGSLARPYLASAVVDSDDLIAVGQTAIWLAAEAFDTDGATDQDFGRVAYFAARDAMQVEALSVEPFSKATTGKYRRAMSAHDSYDDALDASGLSAATFRAMYDTENGASLDAPMGDGTTLHDYLLQPTEPTAAAELLALVVDLDDELEQQVIIMYAGLDGDEPMSDPQIAAQIGLSVATINRVRHRAVANMRKNVEAERNG